MKKWIERIKNSSRKEKAFLTVFIINICFVTIFGAQIGANIAKILNEKVVATSVTGDGAIRGGSANTSLAAIACNVDWGEEEIPKMLDIFEQKGVKVSFFVCGRWAEKNPELLRQMYMRGHEIGNHGYGHKLCTEIGLDELRQEIRKTEEAIQNITGKKTSLFAPPSGDHNADTIALCEDMGYKVILWAADTIDWKQGSTADVIKKRILKKDLNGAIILMHPKPETVKALPEMIDEIQKRGIELVTVGEMIEAAGQTDYR